MKPLHYHDYLNNTVDTGGLVLYHPGISSHNVEYARKRFLLFKG